MVEEDEIVIPGIDHHNILQLFHDIVSFHSMKFKQSQLDGKDNQTRINEVEFIGYGIVITTICMVGILLNALNLFILRHKKYFPESSYSYLFDLALSDLITLTFFCLNSFGKGLWRENVGWRYFEVYAYFPFGSMASNASILLTVTVTIERYIFMYKPILSKSYCTKRTARKVISGIWLFSFFFNIPRFFVMYVGDEGSLAFTSFGKSIFYRIISWIYLIISLSSALCLTIFNTLLICAIHRRRKALYDKKKSIISQSTSTTKDPRGAYECFNHGKPISLSCNTLNLLKGCSREVDSEDTMSEVVADNVVHNDNLKQVNRQISKSDEAIETRSLNLQNNFRKLLKNRLKKSSFLSLRRQQKQREDFALTLTLIAVVIVFLVGELPSSFLTRNIVGPLLGEHVLKMVEYRIVVIVATVLVAGQHSTNFFVYYAFNHKFCNVFKRRLSELLKRVKFCCRKEIT